MAPPLLERWLKRLCDGVNEVDDATLDRLKSDYDGLLKRHLPSINDETLNDASDPLSCCRRGSGADSNSNGENDSWNKYYKANELMNEINLDMDRLYLNGVLHEYFQSNPERIESIKNILFLSCTLLHSAVSYRQGMHEVCALVWYAIESGNGGGAGVGSGYIEGCCWHIFDAVVNCLLPLYDPRPVKQLTEQQVSGPISVERNLSIDN